MTLILTTSALPVYVRKGDDLHQVYLNSQVPDGVPAIDEGYLLNSITSFTASGTYTPSETASAVNVVIIGGGGATNAITDTKTYPPARSANYRQGGGGAGAYIDAWVENIDEHGPQAVTIGAGGTGGTSSSVLSATAGGDSTFGSFIVAGGGQPGYRTTSTNTSQYATQNIGGDGGVPYISDDVTWALALKGANGAMGQLHNGFRFLLGDSGRSRFGQLQRYSWANNLSQENYRTKGAGGQGGWGHGTGTSGTAGCYGGPGFAIIYEYRKV